MCCKNKKVLSSGSRSILSALLVILVVILIFYVRHVFDVMVEKEAYYSNQHEQATDLLGTFCSDPTISPQEQLRRKTYASCIQADITLRKSPQRQAIEDTIQTEFEDHVPFLPWCMNSRWCMGYLVYQIVDTLKLTWWAIMSQLGLCITLAYVVIYYVIPAYKSLTRDVQKLEESRGGLPTTAENDVGKKVE